MKALTYFAAILIVSLALQAQIMLPSIQLSQSNSAMDIPANGFADANSLDALIQQKRENDELLLHKTNEMKQRIHRLLNVLENDSVLSKGKTDESNKHR